MSTEHGERLTRLKQDLPMTVQSYQEGNSQGQARLTQLLYNANKDQVALIITFEPDCLPTPSRPVYAGFITRQDRNGSGQLYISNESGILSLRAELDTEGNLLINTGLFDLPIFTIPRGQFTSIRVANEIDIG